MCLEIKKNAKLKVATKDITVYKSLKITNTSLRVGASDVTRDGNIILGGTVYGLKAAVRNFRYKVGKTYNTTLHVKGQQVFRGFHSYKSKYGVRKYESGTYVECVIPKGSIYYEGTNNGEGKGYASDQIRVVKLL